MRNGTGNLPAPPTEIEFSPVDMAGGERHTGLLMRLRHQNSALEKLRRALDADEDDVGYLGDKAF